MISQLRGGVTRFAKPIKVSTGKQIVYRFNGDPRYDERVSDAVGSLPFHSIGEIIFKNAKRWRVMIMRVELDIAASKKGVPIHHIFLTDKC